MKYRHIAMYDISQTSNLICHQPREAERRLLYFVLIAFNINCENVSPTGIILNVVWMNTLFSNSVFAV